jgi:PASTA domain
MDPEQQNGGFMSSKIMGIPVPVLIIGGALIAYFLFFRNSSSSSSGSGASSSTSGTNTLTTGNTTVDTGAVAVTVNGGSTSEESGNSNPGTSTPTPASTTTVTVPNIVGQRGATAKSTLEKAGLGVSQSPKTTPKGKTTKVTSQNPKAGAKVAKGSIVSDVVTVNK